MANHIITLYDRAVSCDKRLLEQWDKERNGSLTPKDVPAFSHGKAWWLCEKGHSWEAVIASRSRGVGCPVCAGLKILEGYNDLQTRLPELAAEWHPTKNGSLRPTMVARNSHKKVWWQCEKGHEWEATIKSRSTGSGCPVCRNRTVVAGENDLASQAPDIAAQWHPQKNAPITPDQVTAGSQKCVWWLCEHGHEWPSENL